MEKPGLEHAVMIWGAGASMIHIARNMSLTFAGKHKKEKAAVKEVDFSGKLESVSGWTVKIIMSLMLVSNIYHLFFSGAETIQLIYCFGAAIPIVYFFFFGGFFTGKVKPVVMTSGAEAVSK